MAAIMVMLYHADVVFRISTPFARGYLFVDFFFLLSGFVLTLSVEHKLRAEGEAVQFLAARVRRLWPLAAVGTLVGSVAASFIDGQQNVAVPVALALLMIPSFLGTGQLFPLNGPQWSLFLELLANVLHASVLCRLDDRQLRLAILVSALGLATSIMTFGANTLGPFAFNWQWAIPRVAFSYILGVWFARQWRVRSHKPVLCWWQAFILPMACVVALPSLPVTLGISDMLVTIVLFPALFWSAALAPVPPGAELWLGKLGALSFPLYAIHLPIIQAAAFVSRTGASMGFAIAASVAGACLIVQVDGAVSARKRLGLAPAREATLLT